MLRLLTGFALGLPSEALHWQPEEGVLPLPGFLSSGKEQNQRLTSQPHPGRELVHVVEGAKALTMSWALYDEEDDC